MNLGSPNSTATASYRFASARASLYCRGFAVPPTSPTAIAIARSVVDLFGYRKRLAERGLHLVGIIQRIPDGVAQRDPKRAFLGKSASGA